MSMFRSAPRRRLGLLAGATTVLLLASMLAAGPAPALTPCTTPPAVFPQASLTPGTLGSGLTTLAGTTPTSFSFEVIGTIPDGWMLGLDAIVIQIIGPASFLNETGGVFFGMSGSPAYVSGMLAGAVSGVFWDDATFGVLTPAEAMLEVLDAAQRPVQTARTIVPTEAIRREIARMQGVSVSSVTGTFEQLPTPLAVSGLTETKIAELQARLDQRGENFWVHSAASAPTTTAEVTAQQFVPGEPLGAAIAYGDASYYATGTATFTCGDYVAAFGHPFFWDAPGEISLGLSGAEGLMVLKGSGWPGYRFALLTESRGTIVQDRFAGIVGVVGMTPPSVPIVSDLTNLDSGDSRVGTTEAVHTWGWWLEEIVWSHLWANFAAVFGHFGGGSSSLGWTLEGTTAQGPFSVSNRWMASSEWDASETIWRMVYAIDQLQFNGFEDVTFTDISTTGSITVERLDGQIGHVRVASTTQPKLRARDLLKARPGDVVTIEITFEKPEGETVSTVEFEVPKKAKGTLEASLRGGKERNRYRVNSFDELLDMLSGGEHPNDLVVSGVGRALRFEQGVVVRGRDRFWVKIVR